MRPQQVAANKVYLQKCLKMSDSSFNVLLEIKFFESMFVKCFYLMFSCITSIRFRN